MVFIEKKNSKTIIHLQGIDIKHLINELGEDNIKKYFGEKLSNILLEIKNTIKSENQFNEYIFNISDNRQEIIFYQMIVAFISDGLLFNRDELLLKTEEELRSSKELSIIAEKNAAIVAQTMNALYDQSFIEYQKQSYIGALLIKQLIQVYNPNIENSKEEKVLNSMGISEYLILNLKNKE